MNAVWKRHTGEWSSRLLPPCQNRGSSYSNHGPLAQHFDSFHHPTPSNEHGDAHVYWLPRKTGILGWPFAMPLILLPLLTTPPI